jgi:hypothetical protein
MYVPEYVSQLCGSFCAFRIRSEDTCASSELPRRAHAMRIDSRRALIAV